MKKKFSFSAYLAPMVLVNIVLAASTGGGGGLDKVNTFMENLTTALFGVGIAVLTIAIMWAGYKVMFQGQTLQSVAPTLIGGVLVGSAATIASYLLG